MAQLGCRSLRVPLWYVRVEFPEVEITSGFGQVLLETLATVLLVEELLSMRHTPFTRFRAVLVVPERHVYTSVRLVVVLPAASIRKRLETFDPLQIIDRNLSRSFIRVCAIARARDVIAGTAWRFQLTFDRVLVELPGAALAGQTVPDRVGIEDPTRPLLVGEFT